MFSLFLGLKKPTQQIYICVRTSSRMEEAGTKFKVLFCFESLWTGTLWCSDRALTDWTDPIHLLHPVPWEEIPLGFMQILGDLGREPAHSCVCLIQGTSSAIICVCVSEWEVNGNCYIDPCVYKGRSGPFGAQAYDIKTWQRLSITQGGIIPLLPTFWQISVRLLWRHTTAVNNRDHRIAITCGNTKTQ